MLLVEPLKRITIPEIRQHPWFAMHLPRYLAVMYTDPVSSASGLDEEVVAEVSKLGFPPSFLAESIRRRDQNKATVSYYLLMENRRRPGSNAYLQSELTERPDTPAATAGGALVHADASGASIRSSAGGQRLVVERRWRLGCPCRVRPAAAVAELCRALGTLGIAWKKMAPYCFRCRVVLQAVPGNTTAASTPKHCRAVSDGPVDMEASDIANDVNKPASSTAHSGITQSGVQDMDVSGPQDGATSVPNPTSQQLDREIKFEIQLYKARDPEYIFDFEVSASWLGSVLF